MRKRVKSVGATPGSEGRSKDVDGGRLVQPPGQGPVIQPPPEVFAVAQTLLADSVTPEVVQALHAAGIRPVLLKGPALADWLYQDGSRTYQDTDLLVDPARVEQAELVLTRLGFKHPPVDDIPLDRPWHAHAWFRRGRNVDLHRTLIGVRVPPRELWKVLSTRTETTQVGGAEVEILDPPARALHVALHAAQDGTRPGKNAQRDLARALACVPTQVWEEAADLAARLDAVPAFAAGLRLFPAGEALATRLGLPESRSVEVALRASAAPPLSLGFDWLANTPGLRPKLAFLAHKLVPPLAFMQAWTPLAHRGPLGLVAAYLWRPLWLCGNAAPALRAWWRTRRELA